MILPVIRAHAYVATGVGNGDTAILMFYFGASLYFWRERLFINRVTFVALPLIVIAAALIDRTLAFTAYLICLPPFLLHLAYIPGGRIRAVNNWGDYSYGVYIYAFPVQQTLALLFPKLTVIGMSLSAGAISLSLNCTRSSPCQRSSETEPAAWTCRPRALRSAIPSFCPAARKATALMFEPSADFSRTRICAWPTSSA